MRLPESLELALLGVAAILFCVAVVLGLSRRRSTRRDATAPGPRPDSVAPELAEQRRAQQDLAATAEFVRELPDALIELQSVLQLRDVPGALLRLMQRSFGPDQAVVLLRRRDSLDAPNRSQRLIVAASSGGLMGVGSEVAIGDGHLGCVARDGVALDRDGYLVHGGRGARATSPTFDLAAPALVGERVIGVLAVSGPARHHRHELHLLRVIAQLGALTWMRLMRVQEARGDADRDALTGIANKRTLMTLLGTMVYEARTNRTPVSVFMLDIDHFKRFNDTHGHLAGDALLRTLATLVRGSVRADDLFGRFGGEEFLLIMPGRSRQQAISAAGYIRRRIEAYAFELGEGLPRGRVTVSGGVATFPDDGDDVVSLIQAADQALYRAKDAGRNCVLAAG